MVQLSRLTAPSWAHEKPAARETGDGCAAVPAGSGFGSPARLGGAPKLQTSAGASSGTRIRLKAKYRFIMVELSTPVWAGARIMVLATTWT
jgi:hypothetical protein